MRRAGGIWRKKRIYMTRWTRSKDKGGSPMVIDSHTRVRSTAAPPGEAPEVYGPWNPGVESTLPREFLPLSTLFSAANVSSSIGELEELSDFCGLPVERLSTFRS